LQETLRLSDVETQLTAAQSEIAQLQTELAAAHVSTGEADRANTTLARQLVEQEKLYAILQEQFQGIKRQSSVSTASAATAVAASNATAAVKSPTPTVTPTVTATATATATKFLATGPSESSTDDVVDDASAPVSASNSPPLRQRSANVLSRSTVVRGRTATVGAVPPASSEDAGNELARRAAELQEKRRTKLLEANGGADQEEPPAPAPCVHTLTLFFLIIIIINLLDLTECARDL
jgi:hypothetical protein